MARILISLPDELLVEIDARVAGRFTTRSAFLRSAARDALARPDPVAIRAAAARGRAAIAGLGPFESGKAVRAERNTSGTAAARRR